MIWPDGVLTTYWCVSPFWRGSGLAEKAHPGELRALAHHAEDLLHRACVALLCIPLFNFYGGTGSERKQGEPGEAEHGC